MKKLFSSLMVAFFAVTMMAGGAMAASTVSDGVNLDGANPTALVDLDTELYPSELVDKTDGNSEAIISTGDACIAFKLGANVGNNTDITISITNATFGELTLPGDNFYLAVYSDDADAILATDGTYVSGAGVGGVFSNTVTFTTDAALPKDTIVVMVADDNALPAAGVYGGYSLLCDASLAGSNGDITASVTVAGVSAANGSAKIQSYATQLALQADDGVTLGDIGEDQIDVNEDRLKFMGPTLDADDSGIAISKAVADFTGAVVAADINKVTLVIAGDFSGITDPESDVAFNTSDNFTKTYDATAGTLTCVTTTAADITALIAGQIPTITIDGTTILSTRTFTVTGSVDMDSSDFLDTEFTKDVPWAEWTINGYQATMPLLLQSGTQKTYVKFYNESSTEAEVFVDVKNADGTGAETLTLANIPAGQVGSYSAASIIAASTGLAEGTQFTATFTITVPTDDVVGTAFFNLVGSGTRSLVLQ